jgi:two-component system alkaline phosphatase synthesis response regulator PhoP
MQKPSILLVEDEENMHSILRMNLELEGYQVESAFNGIAALQKLQSEYFDLVVLDIMLPGTDGISVLETMRLGHNESPVLILSAKDTPADRIKGLKLGADDYLVKPFELEELLLRVSKLLAKSKKWERTAGADVFGFGGHTVDFKSQTASLKNGQSIELSKKEAALLKLLTDHPNEVVTREKILQTVWGYNVYPTTRTIDNFILNFRKYFEADSRHPLHFHSVRGLGYRFTP